MMMKSTTAASKQQQRGGEGGSGIVVDYFSVAVVGFTIVSVLITLSHYQVFRGSGLPPSLDVNVDCGPCRQQQHDTIPAYCKLPLQFDKFIWFITDGWPYFKAQPSLEQYSNNSIVFTTSVYGTKWSHTIYTSWFTGLPSTNLFADIISGDHLFESMARARLLVLDDEAHQASPLKGDSVVVDEVHQACSLQRQLSKQQQLQVQKQLEQQRQEFQGKKHRKKSPSPFIAAGKQESGYEGESDEGTGSYIEIDKDKDKDKDKEQKPEWLDIRKNEKSWIKYIGTEWTPLVIIGGVQKCMDVYGMEADLVSESLDLPHSYATLWDGKLVKVLNEVDPILHNIFLLLLLHSGPCEC